MKHLGPILLALAAAAALCRAPTAGAQSASASPNVSASLPVRAPPDAPPPALADDPPGADKTPSPKAAEWVSAARVSLTRLGPAAAGCDAYRMREWLRIKCPKLKTFAASLLGGSAEGIAFWIDPAEADYKGSVQFPVRRGDRRIIQFWTFGTDAKGGFAPRPAIVIQEQWIEGDAAPIITAM